MKTSENSNYLGRDGIIYNVYVGDQTLSSFEKTAKELGVLSKQQREKGKPILVLTDLNKLGKVPTKVRQEGVELVRSMNYHKAAIYGDDGIGMQIAKLIIKVSMMDYKIKIFKEKKDALNWLLGR